jgi:hypothetical protein
MNSQQVMSTQEVDWIERDTAEPSVGRPANGPDMTPGALKATIVTLIFAAFYLAVCGAWLWSALYRYQNCL